MNRLAGKVALVTGASAASAQPSPNCLRKRARRSRCMGETSKLSANVFSEVQQKWGLRLDAQKGPAGVVVIDHVERPSAN